MATTCKIMGRKAASEQMRKVLNMAGHRPSEIASLGIFTHITFRGEDAARNAARFLQTSGAFKLHNISSATVMNAGETGGYGSKTHREWTVHVSPGPAITSAA